MTRNRIDLRADPEQIERWRREAKRSGRTLSQWLRYLADGEVRCYNAPNTMPGFRDGVLGTARSTKTGRRK
jgi:hypothetical protein